MVEVDATSCGIREVLLQHHGDPAKMHPCAFCLLETYANYNMGNQELLSIKAALEDTVWRGHNNLLWR